MSSIQVYPLHVGTITRPITYFCPTLDPKITDIPLICWYIEGSDKRILVDTGGVDPSQAPPRWQPYKREKNQSIGNALKQVGVKCEDIDIVIITHLHWDHCGSNDLFSRAKVIVQQEELETARSPFPTTIHAYIREVVYGIDYTVVSGDKEVARGVNVIFTPGHTYGSQGVLVEGETRRIFIAGDTLPLFANLEQDPPTICNSYVDLRKYYESLHKIVSLSAFILPGHDFKVFEREVYY
jgi:N-acyl homoserine lactone hydrolase